MAELILALDYGSAADALAMASLVRGRVKWLKVGLELFCAAGPALVRALADEDFDIFLDLKVYDIPNTAAGAVREAGRMGVRLFTVHCQGGKRMCQRVMEEACALSRPPLIAGVTALTSFAKGEMPGIGHDPQEYALELAVLAERWGLDAVVCSGFEVKGIKARTRLLCICPGIRPGAADCADQRRVMSAAQAVAAGADYLVIGRPITASEDPVASLDSVLMEMAEIPSESNF